MLSFVVLDWILERVHFLSKRFGSRIILVFVSKLKILAKGGGSRIILVFVSKMILL